MKNSAMTTPTKKKAQMRHQAKLMLFQIKRPQKNLR